MIVGLALNPLFGQNTSQIFIDASAPVGKPVPVGTKLGSSRQPDGHTLAVNSQYLLLNGKPWLPVMGEFHYSRYPEQDWEQEILKMKAAGVQIISTYVIWIHHEEIEGNFDWSGQRDLRHFVELCAKHGLYVYPRIGPWAHGEVRNGGLPDWVFKRGPTRRNDPAYIAEVKTFYSQIGQQLKGQLWKDGGPVIGIQLENEYHESGPGASAAHIEKLKQLAIAAGMDVPLYTVTGWDGAAVPLDAVLPVFGGYPAAPWDRSSAQLTASEIYTFRFGNRVSGSMGIIGGSGQNSAEAYRGTPFLTAEVGSGIEDTYFRRPVIEPDDIAAIAPVMLGSGANLLGFYMFHGGRNPDGRLSTLEESQRTGYPTDVPVKSYDFQAPLSEFGEERESLKRLKLVDYFLNDFGSLLAPMQVYPPRARPSTPSDTSIPRVSARADGDRAFIFFNNYVRGVKMPSHRSFQVALKLSGGTLNVPTEPIDMPPGAYGIWPVNLDLSGHNLVYSTAQIFKTLKTASDSYYFFFEIPGIASEIALNTSEVPRSLSKGVSVIVRSGVTHLNVTDPAHRQEITLGQTTHRVHLILMPRAQAENLWNVDGANVLVITPAQVFSDRSQLYLRLDGNPNFSFSMFAKEPERIQSNVPLREEKAELFTKYTAHLAPVSLRPRSVQIKRAGKRKPLQDGPLPKWSTQAVPMAPADDDFRRAAIWKIRVPAHWPSDLSNAFLQIDYRGDVARLYEDGGTHLLDDNFWNGAVWQLGLRDINDRAADGVLRLDILPLPANYPMHIGAANTRQRSGKCQNIDLKYVRIVPQYQLVVKLQK